MFFTLFFKRELLKSRTATQFRKITFLISSFFYKWITKTHVFHNSFHSNLLDTDSVTMNMRRH